MLSINTNLSSLITQNSLKNSTLKLNQAVERMTTGYKVNHAKDNAANYSIATDMTTKIGAYRVAEDNCAMALDLVNTANESLNLIFKHLERILTLATQAGNGTYGEQSLSAINAEVNARVDEIERLYSTAEYNGIKLFGEKKSLFMEEVVKRNTSTMTKLASIDETSTISSGTYSISTAEELAKLATMTNNGKVTGGEFVLANDIDLSAYSTGAGWMPIGNFKGTFDGNGYVISNLYINRPDRNYVGLFGSTDGTVKNIGVENINIIGKDYVGGLVGFNNGYNISNCYSTGTVRGNLNVGGLVGFKYGSSISNCYSTSTVNGKETVGGLVGSTYNGSKINNSYSTGTVRGDINVGGLVGWNNAGSRINNSYSMGSVSGTNTVGGLVGLNNNSSSVNDSYYNSETSRQSDSGKGAGVTTNELNQLIKDGKLPKIKNNISTNSNNLTFQVGINASELSQISLEITFALDVSNLRNIGNSNDNFLSKIDKLVKTVSAKQTEFGAAQNRLESALEEISTHYENLSSSRSTLKDADIANVSSQYIKQQILQQASATLLATANQSPSIALQLI